MGTGGSDAVDPREAVARFPGRRFVQVTRFAGVAEGEPVYFRQGNLRTRGYLVNIGLGTTLGRSLLVGRGFLCMNRGRCYLIPLRRLRTWLRPKLTKGRVMVDVYLDLGTETMFAPRVGRISVSEFRGK